MLEARNVTLKYGARTVVVDLSLTLRTGELTVIIGPNGAGKSSFLQSLNGFLQPTTGVVMLDGQPLKSLSRRRISRRIAVVAQEAELRFPITVLEFILGARFAWAGSSAWGWETEEDLSIAGQVLAETELSQLSARFMNELSGGEHQRAVLARALATQASILLLDEPTANLDLAHQARLLELVRRRCDHGDVAALVVTHDVNLAAQFADNVLLMKEGKAVILGKPVDVLTPGTLRDVFQVEVLVDAHPVSGVPRITPVLTRHRHL